MAKLKFGIIGCGGMMGAHVGNLVQIPDADIVALVDTDAGRIKGTRGHSPALADVPGFDDYRKMLKSVDLDAVVISTPHTLHYKQIMDSLNAGLHVLCEKPLCCTVARAKRIAETAKKKKKVVLVSYQRHMEGKFRFIRKLIQKKTLGKVEYVQGMLCQNWKELTMGLWRQVPELSGGGMLNDSGSHILDIVLWLTGLKVTELSAFIDNCSTPVDINSTLNLKFNNGAQGSLAIIGNAQYWFEEMSIHFSNGVIFSSGSGLSYQTGKGGERHEVSSFPDYGSTDQNFIRSIQGREENISPPVCGLRVAELTEAAFKSAAAGGKVIKVK